MPILFLAAGVALGLAAFPASAAEDDLDLVSRANGQGGAGGDGSSFRPTISADGRYVAFPSDADNLSAADNNGVSNIFVRDLEANTTKLVSRANGSGGAGANDGSSNPAISADGRYVAFSSDADNLSGEDDNSVQNIFVRDLVADTTMLVSRANGGGGAGADSGSFNPSISADGGAVAFQSNAANLSADDVNGVDNIFERDLVANTTTLVSRANGSGGAGADSASTSPSISGDGRAVAFDSDANNLSGVDDNSVRNIFVRDVVANTTTLASRASGAGGAGGADGSIRPSISADGRHVAFDSLANNLSGEDDDSVRNVFVRDLDENTTALVSRASGTGGAGGDNGSGVASISAAGRFVAFDSDADNFSTENQAVRNIFVRDLEADTTEFVSRATGAGGVGGDNDSNVAAISAAGRYVAFDSQADNLSAEDDNGVTNVFRRDVLGPPPSPPPPGPPAPPPPPGLPGAPTSANPVCNPIPERGESKKGKIRYTRTALKIQQNIDSAVIRRLNAANAWIDAGVVPTDLCAGAFGPGAFQEGLGFAGGAPHEASPPNPREIEIVKRPGTGTITRSRRQLVINGRIADALRARAVATVKRFESLTGGNLAPGATLAGREVYPGLQATGAKPPSQDAPAAKLEIGALPKKIPIRPNASTVRKQQQRSQGSIILANRALDAITGGLTEEDFVPGSIGSGRI